MKSFNVRTARSVLLLAAFLLCGSLCASKSAPLSFVRINRPDPDGPTVVHVGAYLINLTTFNEADETFGVDIVTIFSWHDERLAHRDGKAGLMAPLDSIWNPDFMWVNRRSIELVHPKVASIDPNGDVQYVQRIMGTISIPVILNDFPLDKHPLFIEIASRTYPPSEVTFRIDPDELGQARLDGIMTGWRTGKIQMIPITKVFRSTTGKLMDELSGIRISVEADRDWKYYALREILPLVFIVLMASTLFWLPVTEHGMKVGVSTGAIFSLMAYYVQLGRSMPRLSYLTRMDNFLVGATVLIFLSFSFVISGMYLVKRGQTVVVEHIERWARLVFPVLLLAILWGSFLRS